MGEHLAERDWAQAVVEKRMGLDQAPAAVDSFAVAGTHPGLDQVGVARAVEAAYCHRCAVVEVRAEPDLQSIRKRSSRARRAGLGFDCVGRY